MKVKQENTVETYLPQFFYIKNPSDLTAFSHLISVGDVEVFDQIKSQITELIKCRNPSLKFNNEEMQEKIAMHLKGEDIKDYGVWVYYPWTKKIVHLLDENEFVEVRTNRNQNKITQQEQDILKNKKVGIVGLSVGQSIALTIAMERTCGELRLADFDTAELSNLNRLRTGVHNLGIRKTIIAAREIAEIDPFIKVKIFEKGLHADNMNEFFLQDGKLDLLIEVCDGLEIKIESRLKARELKIPVIMDTNDRGMLDIERFDLEPERPILHGLTDNITLEELKNCTPQERVKLILDIIDFDNISPRLKDSISQIGKSISNFPQLASSVVLGGAISTDAARKIFLNQINISGRFYVDTDQIISGDSVLSEKNFMEII